MILTANHYLSIICIVQLAEITSTKLCYFPGGCQIKSFHKLDNYWEDEFVSQRDIPSPLCEIRDSQYQFDFDDWYKNLEKQ